MTEATDAIPEVPRFGQLLAAHIGSVPDRSRPRFLARLERGAADRYRGWAAAVPDHAHALLDCAASEEQIAIRAEGLYAAIPEDLAQIEAALPDAIRTYYDVFDGLSVREQLALQAAAERQGAQAWQRLEEQPGLSDEHRAELDALSALELASADKVDGVVAALAE
ncbi:MAG: hypothetical protein AAF962_15850 [Actinomycetota bacterium]